MRRGTVGVWRSHAMRERRKRTGKEFNNELFLVMTMHEISHRRGRRVYVKSLKNKSTKTRLNFDHGNVWSVYPPIAGKIKRFWWFPISVKAILLKLGDRCFLPLANFGLFLWPGLGTRTQRRVARSSYTTGSTTPPTHPPKNILLRQIKCYFTPKPPTPHKNKSQSCPVGLYHQFHHTTHPTTFVEDFQTHFLKRPEQRYLDFNFYF